MMVLWGSEMVDVHLLEAQAGEMELRAARAKDSQRKADYQREAEAMLRVLTRVKTK